MTECPDCYGPKVFSIPPRGSGLCSTCRGEGQVGFLDALQESMTGVRTPCFACRGTKQCQTCDGSGEVAGFHHEPRVGTRRKGEPEDEPDDEEPSPPVPSVYIPSREFRPSDQKRDQESTGWTTTITIALGILFCAAIVARVLREPSGGRPVVPDSSAAAHDAYASVQLSQSSPLFTYVGQPLCQGARVIKMSEDNVEDYLELHEGCWSGSIQFPDGYATASHVGDDRGKWFQFLFATGVVSPVITTGDPATDGNYRPQFIGSKFQIRGTGTVKIKYELKEELAAETPSAPPDAEIPKPEEPPDEAGHVPEAAEEIIFSGPVLSAESEDERVLVLVRTTEGVYAAFAEAGSWPEITGMSGGEPSDLTGKRVRVTGQECRGTLICIAKIEVLGE